MTAEPSANQKEAARLVSDIVPNVDPFRISEELAAAIVATISREELIELLKSRGLIKEETP